MTEQVDTPETLDLEGAAAYLRLGVKATRRLIDSGEIPAARLNAKHVVVMREHLRAYLRDEAEQQAADRRAGRQPSKRRARRQPLPELPDVTTAAPQGWTPAGSRSARASALIGAR